MLSPQTIIIERGLLHLETKYGCGCLQTKCQCICPCISQCSRQFQILHKMGAFAEFELSFLKIKGKLCAGKIFCARHLLEIGDSLELDLLLASKKGEKPR